MENLTYMFVVCAMLWAGNMHFASKPNNYDGKATLHLVTNASILIIMLILVFGVINIHGRTVIPTPTIEIQEGELS